jgi:dTDP-4-dehydrorhamnose reductase
VTDHFLEKPTRILVLGGSGQIGLELAACTWPEGTTLDLPAREAIDISDANNVVRLIEQGAYAAVINCAAWTAVDKAEDEIVAVWLANAQGPANIAAATARAGIPLVHVSTDYVFSGDLDRPYREDDAPGPRGIYGASKLGGEWAVLTANPRSVVVRTAWVLSPHGANFAKTMLRLATDRDNVSVVADQHGCPTSARDIAGALREIVLRSICDPEAPTGIYHFVNSGEATWAKLARFIFEYSASLNGPIATVNDIATVDYPTRARRPVNSRLGTDRIAADFGIHARAWHEAVAEVVGEILKDHSEGMKIA